MVCWEIAHYIDYPTLFILIFPIIGSVMTLVFSAFILLVGAFCRHIKVLGTVEQHERQDVSHMRRL